MADLINTNTNIATNYNYTDISDGFGLETYYLFARKQASGTGTITTTYHISKDVVASEEIELELSWAAITACGDALTAETQATKVSFTSPAMAQPKVINGTMIADFCYAALEDGGSPNAVRFYPLIEVYHVSSGGTETQLGSSWYGQSAHSVGNVVDIKRAVAYIALGRKQFQRGEFIRIKLGGAACGINGVTDVNKSSIGIDPVNRDGTVLIAPSTDDPQTTTIFKVRIPFEVDV